MSFVMLKQLVLGFLLLPTLALAQNSTTNASVVPNRLVADSLGHGVVNFIASPSVLTLEKNSRGLNNLQGYRIQIFFGPLDQAKAKRQEYMVKGLIHQAYLEQNVPDFSLRIGDFLTESEARQELKNLRPIYPNAFLVKGHIEPPNLNYYINAIKETEN
jgi:hypothetical protein